MKWYEGKYRRHLCDMHISDWNEEFLKEFSPTKYCEMLKKANVNVAMIYLQSHVGLCNWPSKTGKTHNHFIKKPNDLKDLVELCHSNDIKVVGYYSLNFNTWAEDTYEEWSTIAPEGASPRRIDKSFRYGVCCPNNKGYREFVYRQIDEMLEFFSVDGMFFDMLYWPWDCSCLSCKEKYLKETGKEIPKKATSSLEEWLDFLDAKAKWMGEWAQSVTDYVHSIRPEVSVEHNFSASGGFESGCRESVNKASDYIGGDRYGSPYEQSFLCKYYRNITNNMPFEYMTGRCVPNLMNHTVTKTKDKLTQQIFLTIAHHGAFLVIDAIDPVGTLDERFYDLLGELYKKVEKYEPYLKGDLIEDIGLLYSLDSGINLQNSTNDETFLHFNTSKKEFKHNTAITEAYKLLVEKNIPVGIITKNNIEKFNKYRTIVLSNINRLDDDTVDALIKYVEQGGNIYFNNCDEKRLFETLIGGKYIEHTPAIKTYIYPANTKQAKELFGKYNEKYPLPMDMSLPLIEGVDKDKILAYIKLAYTKRTDNNFASIHSDPPGVSTEYPALVKSKYGKGNVIWSAGAIEFHPYNDYKRLFVELLKLLDNRPFTITSTAVANVETLSFKQDNKIIVTAIDLSDFEEFYEMPNFTVTIQTDKPVTGIKRLPTCEDVDFNCDDGLVSFEVKGLKIMEMFEIELQK